MKIDEKILAVDIGGTFIKFGYVDADWNIIGKCKAPTVTFPNAGEFYDYLCESLPSLEGVSRIGVCAPGLIDREGNVKSYAAPSLSMMFGSCITKEITARTGIPCAAINDGKAAGLCELKMGAAKGSESSVCYIVGTGIGGAICGKDDVLYGADGFAGEFHFVSWINEEEEVVKYGRTVGNMGLVNQYNADLPPEKQARYGGEILDLYQSGEPYAVGIVDKWFRKLALHLLSIISTVNPEIFCVGGGVMEREWFLPKLIAEYRKLEDEHFAGQHFLTTKIVPCRFLSSPNLLGAALKADMIQL